MKKLLKGFTAALVCLFLNQTITLASSHREAPLISNDPLADNTDLYAFRSPCNSSKIILIANYIPFEHPAGGPNWYTFGSNIRYEIHVDNNTATPGDDIIYRFTFSQVNQDPTTFFNIRLGQQNLKTTYNLERSINGGTSFTTIVTGGKVPPPNIGPRSIEQGVGLSDTYDAQMTNAIATATTGEKVFAGPVDDPFFVDLGGAFDVGNFRKENMGGRDGVAKFNCHSLVIEVPISTLQKSGKTELQTTSILDADYVIGVWANASRPEVTTLDPNGGASTFSGNWIQVSRLGMPLTNEVIIPIGMKDKWNAATASGDGDYVPYFKNPELALYMDDSQFGTAVPGLADLRIQKMSLGSFDFRNGKPGLFPVKGTPGAEGTAFGSTSPYRDILLPDNVSPRAADLLPIFYTGVPNLAPYQLATGKPANSPLSVGKPFINNFLPTLTDMLRLNMAVPATPRNSADFSSLGLVQAAVLGLTDGRFNADASLQNIPNMDGFPNGRRLEDDITTIELQAVGGVVLAAIGLWYDDYPGSGSPVTPQLVKTISFNAGVTKNDTTLKACFPFVQGPWRGFVGEGFVGPKSNDPLPVKLLGFTAVKTGDRVMLNWQVTNEENSDRYEVEYSADGTRFNKIGTVKSSNGISNNYQLLHSSPDVSRANFYRLKQIDVDGKFSYSPVRMVKFGKNLLTITPNPAINFVKIYSSQSPVNINIFDQGGRKVASQVLTNGMLQIDISRFAKGAYTVVAEDKGERIETKRIVKQ